MNPNKMPAKVFKLVKEEGCNTSGDIADALGVPIVTAAACIGQMVKSGHLRRTGGFIRNSTNKGRRFQVFEVAK
jgi:predicted transcriptional regulator